MTVFERADRIGGLLMYGIPNMKLDKEVVERRVQLMADEGIRFVTGAEVGTDIPAAGLLADFDAVVLCDGRHRAARPRGSRAATCGHPPGHGLPAGKHAVAAGERRGTRRSQRSGASAADHGRRQARGGHRRRRHRHRLRRDGHPPRRAEPGPARDPDRPPDERAADNPWPQWPKVYKLDYAQEEAAALWGDDPRRYAVNTKRFLGDGGRVAAIETVEIEWVRSPGRPSHDPRDAPERNE